MIGPGDPSFASERFSRKVRLFPLPDLVLFPHVMQPLHIFEQRYRDLLEDALASDGLIAMAALAPGWEEHYDGRPSLYPMVCLGRIAAHHRLSDGTYNVLILGLRRARLVRELAPRRRFREARVKLYTDVYSSRPTVRRNELRQELCENLLRVLPSLPEVHEQVEHLLGRNMPLSTLTDVISYMLDIDIAAKHLLLAEPNVYRRAKLLLRHFSDAVAGMAPLAGDTASLCFPPQFSMN